MATAYKAKSGRYECVCLGFEPNLGNFEIEQIEAVDNHGESVAIVDGKAIAEDELNANYFITFRNQSELDEWLEENAIV